MFKSLIANIKSSLKENESARQIAALTDRQFADIGGPNLDTRLLAKAQQLRTREFLRYDRSVGVFSHPTA